MVVTVIVDSLGGVTTYVGCDSFDRSINCFKDHQTSYLVGTDDGRCEQNVSALGVWKLIEQYRKEAKEKDKSFEVVSIGRT